MKKQIAADREKNRKAVKAAEARAKKQAQCSKCKGAGLYDVPSAISPGRTFRVVCTQCN